MTLKLGPFSFFKRPKMEKKAKEEPKSVKSLLSSWASNEDWFRFLISTALWCIVAYKVWTSVEKVIAMRTSTNKDNLDAPTLTLPSVTMCPRFAQEFPNRSRAVDIKADYETLPDVGQVIRN